jgi:hypothetical protein
MFALVGLGVGFQVSVKLGFGITTNSSREKFAVILEDLLKIVVLSGREMCERIGNLIGLDRSCLYAVTRNLVEKGFGRFNS